MLFRWFAFQLFRVLLSENALRAMGMRVQVKSRVYKRYCERINCLISRSCFCFGLLLMPCSSNEEDIIIIIIISSIVNEREEWRMWKSEIREAMRATTKTTVAVAGKKKKKKYTVRAHLLVYFPFGQITTFSSNERKVECITVRCSNVPSHIYL